MPSLIECLEQADTLAQDLVDAADERLRVGEPNTARFGDLLEKAFRYRDARIHVNNRRQVSLTEQDAAAEEQAARQAFAEAYKSWHEEREHFRQRSD